MVCMDTLVFAINGPLQIIANGQTNNIRTNKYLFIQWHYAFKYHPVCISVETANIKHKIASSLNGIMPSNNNNKDGWNGMDGGGTSSFIQKIQLCTNYLAQIFYFEILQRSLRNNNLLKIFSVSYKELKIVFSILITLFRWYMKAFICCLLPCWQRKGSKQLEMKNNWNHLCRRMPQRQELDTWRVESGQCSAGRGHATWHRNVKNWTIQTN